MSDQDNYDDELVSSNPNQRNWRGILIAMLVIMSVLALIVTSVVLLTPPDNGPRVKAGRLKLQEILSHELTPLRFNGSWIADDQLMYKDENSNIVVLNAVNLTTKVIMPSQTFRRFSIVKFTMSPDGKFLLLVHNTKKLFRHSFLAQYTAYDVSSGQTYPVTVSERHEEKQFLVHAQWSTRGNGLLIVLDYDIYFRPNPRSQQVYRITSTAVPGLVHNGVPDWLYEEEILDDNKAMWMSKDARLLLFASFNDTLVQEFQFPWYGVDKDTQQLYPEIRKLRYPKPGTTNPHVTLYIADLADPKNIKIKDLKAPMALGQTTDYYFNGVSWVSATEVAVVWMNRAQNISMVTLCKNPMWFCQETQRVSGMGKSWVEAPPPPIFSNDGNTYLTLAPVKDGSAGFFRHIVSVNIPKKGLLPITQGTFEVVKIVSWHLQNHVVYYLAIYLSQLHLYSVKMENNSKPLCLSCPKAGLGTEPSRPVHKTPQSQESSLLDDADYELPTTEAPPKPKKKKEEEPQHVEEPLYRECLYHNAIFSPNSTYYVLECLGPGIPTVWLYKTDTGCIMNLQNNSRLYDRVSKVALPQVRTFPVEISGGYQAQVRLFLPPGLREGEITKYPLILQVYGGPGSQLVTDKWKIDWGTYLASTQDIIVGYIDGRGTSGKGYTLTHQVYMKLGAVEAADQLEVTEYLRDNLHFIDKRRVGVWGWSYGGFVAAMLLSSPGQQVFQCGAAVAPITSWRLYDSAYTERYMGMPNVTGNYKGYEEAELSKRVNGLKDKSLYLVHGTADDNVHLQQALHYARALSSAGIVYSQQIYPDENHSLSGVKKHLYRSLENFFNNCFRKQVPQESKAGLRNGGAECDVCSS
ncbi:inactive dipeptidyl peptidase 10 [Cimex lectularius]|uniref:Venom dipeptidyl peptidase 4 n=1 Tax=Cimex lectularius TaxID=79782 RepID=A0A8I6R9V7_CIMLE|nr:inactive dipeptidyl peptidase 10 [Cimex lectularius]